MPGPVPLSGCVGDDHLRVVRAPEPLLRAGGQGRGSGAPCRGPLTSRLHPTEGHGLCLLCQTPPPKCAGATELGQDNTPGLRRPQSPAAATKHQRHKTQACLVCGCNPQA